LVTFTTLTDANFELVLSSRVCNNLPVVYAFVVSDVAKESSEEVIVLLEIEAAFVVADLQHVSPLSGVLDIPNEAGDEDSDYLAL